MRACTHYEISQHQKTNWSKSEPLGQKTDRNREKQASGGVWTRDWIRLVWTLFAGTFSYSFPSLLCFLSQLTSFLNVDSRSRNAQGFVKVQAWGTLFHYPMLIINKTALWPCVWRLHHPLQGVVFTPSKKCVLFWLKEQTTHKGAIWAAKPQNSLNFTNALSPAGVH